MRTRLLTLLLLPLLLLVAADNAFGQFDENILYRMTAKHSGRCLAVARGPGSVEDGVAVIQWDCIESETNQLWQVLRADDGYYRIIAWHSQKALSVFGGIVSQGNGVSVQQWSYNHGDNQMWSFNCLGDGFYEIIARHSGKALDINGGPDATGNGPHAQQWDNWHGPNQTFRFQPFAAAVTSYRSPTPATCPSEADASIGVNLYTADNRFYRRTRQFSIDQTIALKIVNNTGSPIYLNEGLHPERLIREEGLQVERLNGSSWFPVLPSGSCGPDGLVIDSDNGAGTSVAPHERVTQLFEFRATMNITRRWTTPAGLGPGTYRLSLAYYRNRNTQRSAPSFVCSSTFEVTR